MVAALWFSETLGSNYNAGKLPLVAGVPVDPINSPAALLSKGVVTACDSFTATTITFSEEQWAGFSPAPVAGDSACIELSGTGAGQYIVTFTDVTNRVCTWTGGTTNGLTGVASLNTSGTFVRCGVGGARLNLSTDVLALGGCLSHFGTALLAPNHQCYLDGAFTVVPANRNFMMPDWIGWPSATITLSNSANACITTQADAASNYRAFFKSHNIRWVGGASGQSICASSSQHGATAVEIVSCKITGLRIARNQWNAYSRLITFTGYTGISHSYIEPADMIMTAEFLTAYANPNAISKSIIKFTAATSYHRGVMFYYDSGAGVIKDCIVQRTNVDASADKLILFAAGHMPNADEGYNVISDVNGKELTYDGTNYYGTPRTGSNDLYTDPKYSVDANGFITLDSGSPCLASASDSLNRGPANLVISGDDEITINRGEASSNSWTITDAAGTSSVVKPYISTGTLPAGLSLSSFGYSPLTATISGTCTADPGEYVVVLRGSNGVTAAYKTITVTVVEPHIYPVADAGDDQNVGVGATVNLDGSGSTDAVSYSWAQTAGDHTVTLINPTTATPHFTFPSSYDVLTFELTVTSSTGDTDTDTVTITASAVTLSVAKVGKGAIVSDSGNPIFGASGAYTVTTGGAIILEARPAHGYKFTAWSGAAVDSAPILTLTMDADKSITGTFSALEDGRRAAPLRMPPYRGRPIR